MQTELTENLERAKQRLAKIPDRMPEHWKNRNHINGHAQLFHCDPDCPICSGSDYYRKDVPKDHPDFGKLFLCPQINRFKLPFAARFGIPEEEAMSLNWDYLKQFRSAIGIQQAREAVHEVLRKGYGWVFIHGDFGIGKTLVLKIATALTLQAGNDAAYVRMAEILDHLRASFDDNSRESETDRLSWWTDLPVLCIDEFDKVRKTDYGKERSFVLLDRRYEQAVRQDTVTIIASNQAPDSFDGYLYDRIRDGRFFVREIRGESARPGMRYD